MCSQFDNSFATLADKNIAMSIYNPLPELFNIGFDEHTAVAALSSALNIHGHTFVEKNHVYGDTNRGFKAIFNRDQRLSKIQIDQKLWVEAEKIIKLDMQKPVRTKIIPTILFAPLPVNGYYRADDWIQIIEAEPAAGDADVGVQGKDDVAAKDLAGHADIADDAHEPPAGNEHAKDFSPDLVQLGEEMFVVFDVPHLVGVFVVALEAPIGRGGDNEVDRGIRDEAEVACIAQDKALRAVVDAAPASGQTRRHGRGGCGERGSW